MKRFLPALALLIASTAAAFPYVDTNTPERGITWAFCDTLNTPAGPSGRSRTIYLVANTSNVGIDSVLNVWRNTGTAPAFRRIQGFRICDNENAGAGALVVVTIFKDGATSSMNRLFLWPFVWVELPFEADSIVVKSATAATASIAYCAW